MLKNREITITEKDYLTFRYFAFLYDYSSITTVFWVSAISIAVLVDYVINQRNLLIALIGAFMIINYIQSIFFKMPETAKSEYSSRRFPNSEYTFSLSENTLTIIRENSKNSEIALTSLHSAFETLHQFCFFISQNNYVILPKNKLSNEEKDYVRRIIFSLPRKNRKNPFAPGLKRSLKNLFMILFITVCAIIMIIAYKIV